MKPADFSDAVRRTARRYGMDLSRPLALVSGGPDSVALLRALLALGAEPVVLHVNHGLRGEESREDAGFVRDLCDGLNVRCEVKRLRLEEGPGLQERARDERYRLAEELADELGLQAIAVGHTADDVAETVLMNLARGTGLRGLAGIAPVRGRVVRPLIRHRRREVLNYLKYLNQAYRTDPTNLTGKYARNRVRLEVLPVLEELYPGATSNIARGASLAREDLEVLEGLAAGVVHQRGSEIVVLLDDLRKMPPALQRHAVRRAYSTLEPETASLDSATVEGILKLTRKGEGTRMMYLPGYVIAAIRFGEELALYHATDLFSGEEDLLVGKLGFDRWVIDVQEVQEFDAADAARPEVAYLDAVRGPSRVRMG